MECAILHWLALRSFPFRGGEGLEEVGQGGGAVVGGEEVFVVEVLQGAGGGQFDGRDFALKQTDGDQVDAARRQRAVLPTASTPACSPGR